MKPDKKAEALDLLHSVAKNGYGEQFLELAYDHGVPPAEKGKVTALVLPEAQLQSILHTPSLLLYPSCREVALQYT